jgi:hypothetical protein
MSQRGSHSLAFERDHLLREIFAESRKVQPCLTVSKIIEPKLPQPALLLIIFWVDDVMDSPQGLHVVRERAE